MNNPLKNKDKSVRYLVVEVAMEQVKFTFEENGNVPNPIPTHLLIGLELSNQTPKCQVGLLEPYADGQVGMGWAQVLILNGHVMDSSSAWPIYYLGWVCRSKPESTGWGSVSSGMCSTQGQHENT